MKAPADVIKRLELLFEEYEKEVSDKLSSGLIAENTAKTYLLHSGNFIKWCRDEFAPGARNQQK
ncbi:hypothetical protein BK121_26780 [Paenibacillus odorifer]|uniref:hypothetical protein n=1 Tax=Paenibacillus TaxID=44249 RepID=UPI00096C3F57|nr:hypothetical protein [Paenibacillus odorifer]OMC63537.1 hypothetical protein BK121_26780 [Paenibacillus odorifer]